MLDTVGLDEYPMDDSMLKRPPVGEVKYVEPEPSALNVQVGGGHYKDMAIQPVEYILKNKLGFIEGNIVKYISRYEKKNGVEDLKKIKHFVDLLIELKYGNQKGGHRE